MLELEIGQLAELGWVQNNHGWLLLTERHCLVSCWQVFEKRSVPFFFYLFIYFFVSAVRIKETSLSKVRTTKGVCGRADLAGFVEIN